MTSHYAVKLHSVKGGLHSKQRAAYLETSRGHMEVLVSERAIHIIDGENYMEVGFIYEGQGKSLIEFTQEASDGSRRAFVNNNCLIGLLENNAKFAA